MKKLIIGFCCLFCIKAASAQQLIKLDVDSTTMVKKLVIPNLDNMEKLLKASQKDYAATMLSLGYKIDKVDDANLKADIYMASTRDESPLFSVLKTDSMVMVMFYQTTTYPKQMKDLFLSQYSNVVHKRSSGMDNYYFKLDDDNTADRLYMMSFDTPRKNGGSVSFVITE